MGAPPPRVHIRSSARDHRLGNSSLKDYRNFKRQEHMTGCRRAAIATAKHFCHDPYGSLLLSCL